MITGEKYSVFVTSAAGLSFPLQATDWIAVTRFGTTFHLGATAFVQGIINSLFSYIYAAPLTGDTLSAAPGQGAYILNPAGTIATLNVVLPVAPLDGAIFEVSTTQDITALTIAAGAGATMAITSGGPFLLAANGGSSWRFRSADNKWYPRY